MVSWNDDTTVTLGELKDAAGRIVSTGVHYRHGTDAIADGTEANSLAVNLVRNVLQHREPHWHIGDVVISADNIYYKRVSGGMWDRFGETTSYGHHIPKRPLALLHSFFKD